MNPVSAIAGVNMATMRFERASQRLLDAAAGASKEDTAIPTVEMVQAKAAFTASVRALRAANEMTATLFDIIA
jgi:hypothetical protein